MMIISNAITTSTVAPSTVSEITRTNAKPMVNDVQSSQKNQQSTIVQLSTQGQLMSLGDRPGSNGESTETRSKESGESPSIQFMEGEGGGGNNAMQAAASGAAAYMKVAAA